MAKVAIVVLADTVRHRQGSHQRSVRILRRRAFGVKDQVQSCDVKLLSEYDGHPSFKKLVDAGYQIITF